jgi:hypothetical protein
MEQTEWTGVTVARNKHTVVAVNKQARQFTYNVLLRGVRVAIVAVAKQ